MSWMLLAFWGTFVLGTCLGTFVSALMFASNEGR